MERQPAGPTITTDSASAPRPVAAPHSGLRNYRAVLWGAAVIVGGSLVMNTLVGIAAITGMLMHGDSAEKIVAQLPSSPALAVFAAMGGLLMSLIGGYTAAMIAKAAPIGHAVAAGLVAIAVTLALTPLWDDSASLGFTALLAVAILPCAVFGAWLAQPVEKAKASATVAN